MNHACGMHVCRARRHFGYAQGVHVCVCDGLGDVDRCRVGRRGGADGGRVSDVLILGMQLSPALAMAGDVLYQ